MFFATARVTCGLLRVWKSSEICPRNSMPYERQLVFPKSVLKICILFCKKPLFEILDNSREPWIMTKAWYIQWVSPWSKLDLWQYRFLKARYIEAITFYWLFIGTSIMFLQSLFIWCSSYINIGGVFVEFTVPFNHCWVFANKDQKRLRESLKDQLKNKDSFFLGLLGQRVLFNQRKTGYRHYTV